MATFLRNFNCLSPCTEVSVKILVDEVRNKVLFVQAGKDFVDVLLSFLTLPLGTIARLVSQESNMENVCVGSLSLLYESVANLDKEKFRSAIEKELLVRPINSMDRYCKYLKLNIDDTEKLRSFNCGKQECIDNPAKRNCKCCEKKRTSLCVVKHHPKNGFVPATATFLISDDLNVKPDNSQLSQNNTIKIVTVDVTRKEILDLVKCSLISATPLTDVFLSKKLFLENPRPFNVFDIGSNIGSETSHFEIREVKAMMRKSNNKILYVLGEEDFADLLLNFLRFPLGGVENMLNGNSGIDNIDNLFKSMVDLDRTRYFKSKSDFLSKQVESNFDGKQIIKSPSTYMVTDDLAITPGSSTDAISFLTKMRIPLSDLEERRISIGNKEAHSLLKASLISSSALTNGLGPFLATNDKKILN
ncbi:MZB10.14 protein [Medicago truncatula]|uniref:MZB10.14 protein n=1 Tax=Medicago truncatula TaxID=3880 RepID=A0A072U1S0_MEDTR|nr:MZB10.14 protein [Medicago truncatula]